MELPDFLIGAFVYLAAAVVAAPIASRLGLGSVLGYLAAGILIGPAVLGLVGSEGQDMLHFAEFGVIVMLFLVGLELQPSKVWSLRKPILGLGGMQVLGTSASIALAAYFIGLDWKAAVATGLILAMSSTAIVIQSLNERGQLKTFAGQSSFSVLLFQDIAIIPMLALLPLLAVQQSSELESSSLIADLPAWAQTFSVLAAVAAIVLAGRCLMRPLFRFIAQSGIREGSIHLKPTAPPTPSRASMKKLSANKPATPATMTRWWISSAAAAPNFHAYWPGTAPSRHWVTIRPGKTMMEKVRTL